MRISYFISCFFIALIFGSLLSVANNAATIKHFKNEAHLILSETILKEYFIHNDSIKEGNTITLSLEPTNTFRSLNNEEQFIYLSQFHRLLRYHLKEGSPNYYYSKDIRFNLTVNDNTYKYYDVHDERYSLYLNKGVLEIGDSKILETCVKNSSTFIKKHIEPRLKNKTNGYYDVEIVNYMKRLSKVLTKKGLDVNTKKDNHIIAKETMKKYDLSINDISKIFFEWYFFVFDNPYYT